VRLGNELRQLRLDANLTQRAVATAAQIDQGFLSQVEGGRREPSFAVLIALGHVLGADLAVRMYPTTGPRIRDRTQAAMVEALLHDVHPRWKRLLEVPDHRPARGFIDTVLASPLDRIVVAVEAQSELRRIEQQIRWAKAKAESLPSASDWAMLAPAGAPQPVISRLLVIRSSHATRELARMYEANLMAAYPARAWDIHQALTTGTAQWPGAGIIWAAVEGGRARILDRPPRGVSLGR
jgi:transcriptional regulator with XRE-family HTH domain